MVHSTTSAPARPLCLSVRQPWASLIVAGLKRFDPRYWSTTFRGRIYIHAARVIRPRSRQLWNRLVRCHPDAVDQLGVASLDDLPRGGIIGSVQLLDCFDIGLLYDQVNNLPMVSSLELACGEFSHGHHGPFVWMFGDPSPCPFEAFAGEPRLFVLPRHIRAA